MTKKLNADDLQSINDLRSKFQDLYSSIGLLTIDKNLLTTQLEHIDSELNLKMEYFNQLRSEEEQLMSNLKNQYGDGHINITDGTFTPAGSITPDSETV